MLIDEEQRLREDERLDDIIEGLADDLIDLRPMPTGHEIEHLIPGTFQAVVVRAEEHVRHLCHADTQQRPPAKESCAVQRPAEREGRRTGDDGLVEIEERGFGHVRESIGATDAVHERHLARTP